MARTDTRRWDPSESLSLQDIALWDSTFKRVVEYQDGLHSKLLTAQSKRGVTVEMLDVEDASGRKSEVLRVLVHLGVRATFSDSAKHPEAQAGTDEDSEASFSILHYVEATFSASYLVKQELTQRQISEFATFNAVHNVWPFWREHVYSTLKNASLPLIEVPFFAGSRVIKNAKK